MIRRALYEDAAALASLHVRSWQTAYAHIFPKAYLDALSIPLWTARWQKSLNDDRAATDIAQVQDKVAGFVSYGVHRIKPGPIQEGEIWTLYVDPDYWKLGIGTGLLDHALKALSTAGHRQTVLWVLSQNTRAIRLYERVGFEPVETTKQTLTIAGLSVEEFMMSYRDIRA